MSAEHKPDSAIEIVEFSGVLEPERLAKSVSSYLESSDENSTLHEHQLDVFKDLEQFFVDGHRRGYIELPTGTGKTVLFVELAKALLNTLEGVPKPNILVATPTQDLVRQTLGQSGVKGFGGFASELEVRPYYGQSTQEDREKFTAADVGITTYRSLDKLRFAREFVPAKELGAQAIYGAYARKLDSNYSSVFDTAYGQLTNPNRKGGSLDDEAAAVIADARAHKLSLRKAQTYMKDTYNGEFIGKPMLNTFDIIFLDEAHHALEGTAAWYLIDKVLAKDKVVIGFTATPDASSERQLSKVLPEKIHTLSLSEAIDMNLLSPLVPIAIKSGMRIEGSEIYNESGEYIDDKISYLARSEERNAIIMDTAEVFAGSGIGTIISCIAGGEAQHARELADGLNERGVTAAAVYSRISSEERAHIYQEFETGKIDVLTFIGVLGEGWDSQRAKAIINARPTRSSIFATQRPGRVARPGGIAYTVDIHDDYETGNPPISVADILSANGAEYGQAFGQVTDEDREHINVLLEQLAGITPVIPKLQSAYRSYQEMLAAAPKVKRGSVIIHGREYTTPKRTSGAYRGVTADILVRASELQGITLEESDGDANGLVRTVFNRAQSSELLRALPTVKPEKYYIDSDQVKWISSVGLATLFSKRYPDTTATGIDMALKETTDKTLEWIPARMITSQPSAMYTTYRTLRMYNTSQETLRAIHELLRQQYEKNS